LHVNPVTGAETAWAVAPVNVTPEGDNPYPVVVPYSNVTVAEPLLGFTEPLSVAPVCVMFVADPVVAIGARHADVVNARSDPGRAHDPKESTAITRK
jgi:hypothetical protein